MKKKKNVNKPKIKKSCPPHTWDKSGERCVKCGCKDWMT